MMNTRMKLVTLSAAFALAGCGGGSGTSSQGQTQEQISSPVVVAPEIKSEIKPVLYATSYQNAKSENLEPFTLPIEANAAAAYARADFKANGKFTLFTAQPTSGPDKPIEQATLSKLAFWSQKADGSYVEEVGMIDAPHACVVARKAVVADFNNDKKPDILLACTGYDGFPFPGERMYIVESTASGIYHVRPANDAIGFFHGAAAADLDGDGLIDFVATDGKNNVPVRAFKNMGDGNFKEILNAFPSSLSPGGYFTTELVDLNDDGKIDLLLGGHEFAGTTTYAVYGDGKPFFGTNQIKTLPAAGDVGVVLDFLRVGNVLYVGRTSGGTIGFYTKLGMQTIDLTTFTTTSVTAKDSLLFTWLLPLENGSGVVSDKVDRPL